MCDDGKKGRSGRLDAVSGVCWLKMLTAMRRSRRKSDRSEASNVEGRCSTRRQDDEKGFSVRGTCALAQAFLGGCVLSDICIAEIGIPINLEGVQQGRIGGLQQPPSVCPARPQKRPGKDRRTVATLESRQKSNNSGAIHAASPQKIPTGLGWSGGPNQEETHGSLFENIEIGARGHPRIVEYVGRCENRFGPLANQRPSDMKTKRCDQKVRDRSLVSALPCKGCGQRSEEQNSSAF